MNKECCFNCVFCSEQYQLPFADFCDIDNQVIDDVYVNVCTEFIGSENNCVKEDYATLLDAARNRFYKEDIGDE